MTHARTSQPWSSDRFLLAIVLVLALSGCALTLTGEEHTRVDAGMLDAAWRDATRPSTEDDAEVRVDADRCVRTTCASAGRECGALDDGCGSELHCGECMAPQRCGGNGIEGVCGCTPLACEADQCGTVDDGCGGALDCGGCGASQVCVEDRCLISSCTDAVRGGDETDVDCGGSCAVCEVGQGCGADEDCRSGHCESGRCQPPEDCRNGLDDDADGLVDCADPDCVAYTCVGAAPTGWSGPVALYDGAGPGSCSAPYGTERYRGNADLVGATSGRCSSCGCGTPTGVSCGARTVSWYQEPGCGGSATTETASTTCRDLPTFFGAGVYDSFRLPSPSCTGGRCAVSGGVRSRPTPTWSRTGVACGATSALIRGGCASGQLCAPDPTSPFLSTMCIHRSGTHACPAPYTTRRIFYSGYSDSRDCTDCSCSAPSGFYDGSIVLNSQAGCTGSSRSDPHSTSCRDTGTYNRSYRYYDRGYRGSCTASGGDEIGAATPSGATTVCCLP